MYKQTIRILNIPLNWNKPLFIGLKKIKGLGESRIREVISRAKLLRTTKISKLTNKQVLRLISRVNYYRIVKQWKLAYKLNQNIQKNIRLLIHIKCRRGIRHQFHLPVRGQRTHTNRQTIRKLKFLKI